MAKRRSEEARVLSYFVSAPLEKAELMLGLVKDQVKQRAALGEGGPIPNWNLPAKKRRARKARAAGASAQTSFSTRDDGTIGKQHNP